MEREEFLEVYRHSLSHILAKAVIEIFGKENVQYAIGPLIADGFYYDFMLPRTVTNDDFKAIEDKKHEINKRREDWVRKEVSREEALSIFKSQKFKTELINDLPEDELITIYYTGDDYVDLCRGPHIDNSQLLMNTAFQIKSVSGSYWRGDENREQLQRIYVYAFPDKKALKEHLNFVKEAMERDHKKIGPEMELFMFSDLVGKGLPMWLPKGTALRLRLEDFLKAIQKRYGYQQVMTPHIGSKNLYVTSGHYAKYGKDSFQPIHTPEEGEEYMLKPMNCPHHCSIFAWKPRSYKELPLRLAEFGTVYRYEQSGELHGLTRVRGFTQDDAHIFCTPEQVKDEFLRVMDIIMIIFRALKFDKFEAQISLRDKVNRDKYIGSEENWEHAEQAIIEACKEKGLEARVEYGEAAFYGPKLDFMVKDAIGRRWQLGTIQVDYNLPERFQLEYTGADNQKHRPVMIHRAPFGSMERFVAVLIEHTAGHFPLWLTPDQVVVLPISDKYNDYANEVCRQLNDSDVRATVDDRSEKIGRKIRDNEMKHIPYLLIVGENEVNEGTVSIRKQGEGDQGSMKIADFAKKINDEVAEMTKNY